MKWLSLIEYSYKYKVSVDSLRKKIQSNQIEYMFIEHEYQIPDKPFFDHYPTSNKEIETKLTDYENQIQKLTSQLEKKEKTLQQLSVEYKDLKNLLQFLEKENQTLKDVLFGMQKIDNWIEQSKDQIIRN